MVDFGILPFAQFEAGAEENRLVIVCMTPINPICAQRIGYINLEFRRPPLAVFQNPRRQESV